MFTSHPTITKAQGLLPKEPRASPGKKVTLCQHPQTLPKGLGTAGAGRQVSLCSLSLSPRLPSCRKAAASPPRPPTPGVACPQAGGCRAGPPTRPRSTWGAVGPGSCSMLTAGQRCYSGPAPGGDLADRVSASNASHAPATAAGRGGGGTHTTVQRPKPLRHPATPQHWAGGGWLRPQGQRWPWRCCRRAGSVPRPGSSQSSWGPFVAHAHTALTGVSLPFICPRPPRGFTVGTAYAGQLNLLPCLLGHPLLPVLRSLPAPFLFQEGSNNPLASCRAGPGAAVGERTGGCQAKGTRWLRLTPGGQLDPVPWRGARSKTPVPWWYPKAGKTRRDEAGGSVLGTGQQEWGDRRTHQLPWSQVALAPQRCRGRDGVGPLQLCRPRQPGSSLATSGCWQWEREKASPLSAAIFRCWREAEEQ